MLLWQNHCFSGFTHMQFFSQWFVVTSKFTVVCRKFNFFKFFNSCKMLKMLKIGWSCFKQNYCISGMPHRYSNAIFCSTAVKVMLLWPALHIFTVVCSKFCFFKNFNSWKIFKILKIGCFKLFYAKSLYLRCTSRYSHAIFFSIVVKVL